MIKAVFFDLDGTLSDSIGGLRKSMNIVMNALGCDEISPAQTKQYIGNGYQVFVKKSLQATADRLYREAEAAEKKDPDLAMDIEMRADDVLSLYDDACAMYLDTYALHNLDDTDAYPGMRELIAKLKEGGMKIACITNKPEVATKWTLDGLFGENCFDYVVCDDNVTPRKPDPAGCFAAMEALKVKADEVLYLGDTATDMHTAANAGLTSVGCLYGFRDEEELLGSGASYLISEPLDLIEILGKINKK